MHTIKPKPRRRVRDGREREDARWPFILLTLAAFTVAVLLLRLDRTGARR